MLRLVGRILVLVLGVVIVFVAVAGVLTQIVPQPHRTTDYLVIGSVATLVSLVVLFVVLITGWVKNPDVFYKRRVARRANEGPAATEDSSKG